MKFKKYQKIRRLGEVDTKGINAGTCYVFPKLDGCFPYRSQIMLADGSTESIGTIVNQEKEVVVLSYDLEKGEIIEKKVTNWFKYNVDEEKINEEWVSIGVDRNGLQLISKANSRIKINVTKNHNIFVERKRKMLEIPAEQVEVGDYVFVPSKNLSVIQKQILLGTLLGDGSAFPNKKMSRYNGIEYRHSQKQKEYVKHKNKLLGNLTKNYKEYTVTNSYGKEKCVGNTKCNKRTQQIYDICYREEEKRVTRNWVDQLDSLGLAIWYMDDGSLKKQLRSEVVIFHVEGFSKTEQTILRDSLYDRGYDPYIVDSGKYKIIRLGVEGSNKFFTDISQHIIPSMQYKLPERFRGRYTPLKDDINTGSSIQKRKVISVDSGVSSSKTVFHNGFSKYDIKIKDTHTYFCDGILVHNSNGQTFMGEDGEVKAASRNRVCTIENDNQGFCAFVQEDESIQKFHRDHPDKRLYGEWLVPHTLRTYRDEAWEEFYVFDVMQNESYIPYPEYKELLEEYDIEYIAPLGIVKDGGEEAFRHYLDKNKYLIEDGEGTGEGVVVKNMEFVNQFGRTQFAKIVRNDFKEKHNKVQGPPEHKHKSIEREIADTYVTSGRVEKIYQKIKSSRDGWRSEYIPELLGRVYHDLVTEEAWNFVQEHNNPTVDFGMLKHMTINNIKQHKPELF